MKKIVMTVIWVFCFFLNVSAIQANEIECDSCNDVNIYFAKGFKFPKMPGGGAFKPIQPKGQTIPKGGHNTSDCSLA